MRTWQKIGLAVVITAVILGIIVFWGSIFSGVMIFSLVMTLPVYLYNRFINVDRESDFQDEDDYY